MDRRNILPLLLARDESALTALERCFGAGLLAFARRILTSPEDAEEAVNDTYLALWNAIPPEQPDPLEPYIYRVCRNLALKRQERNQAGKRSGLVLSLDELSEILPGTDAEASLNARELGRAVDRFLDTQNKTNRILFLRRYWFGDSIPELAQRTGMSDNAVSVRLLRLRSKLKQHLIKEGLYYE